MKLYIGALNAYVNTDTINFQWQISNWFSISEFDYEIWQYPVLGYEDCIISKINEKHNQRVFLLCKIYKRGTNFYPTGIDTHSKYQQDESNYYFNRLEIFLYE